MRRFVLSLLPLALMACGAGLTPPAPPTPRSAMDVGASADRTWDAVIEAFAERNIPIRTMERVSGFISTDPLAVGKDGGKWADCGTVMGLPLSPDRATYNVVVRGDSTRSTVKATVRWTQGGTPDDPTLIECSTKGVWETDMEGAIKERAERKVAAKP